MIVSNPVPLDISYVPQKLFFRDDKIAAIRSSVLAPSSSGISNNIIIHGDSGTGKTSTVKFLMRDSKSIIYENALSFKNVKALLEHVLSRLGKPVSYRGLSFPDIFSTLNSVISFRGNTVLVIDEATNLLKSDTDGLYNLFRASEIYGTSLSTILISMENPFSYMDRKYGTVVELKFNKYSGSEIYRIISERAALSLEDGAYTDSILKYISEISAPVGSARFAIELLQKAAYMAEYRLSDSIENDDVRSAVSLINPYITESKLSLLDRRELLVLLSICSLLSDKLSVDVHTVENQVKLTGESYSIDIKKAEMYRIIRKLESMDIVSSTIQGRGNRSGVSKHVSINDVPVSILSIKIRDIIARL
ncbi:MAG: orc1/cdc6 family replication initiation protein [Ferroplasma sp.]|uniref:Cdc6/Cdc18 family protein n=1 Tax=Ferroplasma sp. TaxID=2591003 RepID=UPI002816059B|nr:orc1/cdc6 family replication initiation protein [Ferroplasma sp.]WMT51594.1 MAG: orc1/cdc6 family replication initiation protein [Ferroplasma sp.]